MIVNAICKGKMQNICEYKCKCDGRKCNSNQNWNKELCRCECKNVCEKIMFGILVHVLLLLAREINRNLKSIADYLVITCDTVIDAVAKSHNDTSESAPISFNKNM